MIELFLMALAYNVCISENPIADDTGFFEMVVDSGNDWEQKINNSELLKNRSSEFYGNKINFSYKNLNGLDPNEQNCSITIKEPLGEKEYLGNYDEENNTINIPVYFFENDLFVKIEPVAKAVIIRHEMGHWLGLPHLVRMGDESGYTLTKKSIMFPVLRLDDTEGIEITSFDVNSVISKIFQKVDDKSYHVSWVNSLYEVPKKQS
jgi:hypothetical protein